MLSDVTMVVFVYKNPKVLVRVLEYYAKTNMKIIVSDASKEALPRNVISSANKHVSYLHVPQQSSDPAEVADTWVDRMCVATSLIDTDFAVMRSNRRHTLVSGLCHARNFLLKNSDYVSAQGHTFNIGKTGSMRPGYYKYHLVDVCEAESRYERMKMGMLFYSPIFYSLQRSKVVQRLFKVTPKIGILRFPELFHAVLTLYYGKHKALPCAFCCNLNRPDNVYQSNCCTQTDISTENNEIINFLPSIVRRTAKLLGTEDREFTVAMYKAIINYLVYFCEIHKTVDTHMGSNIFKEHFLSKFSTEVFDRLTNVLVVEKHLKTEDITASYSKSDVLSMHHCINTFKDCYIK